MRGRAIPRRVAVEPRRARAESQRPGGGRQRGCRGAEIILVVWSGAPAVGVGPVNQPLIRGYPVRGGAAWRRRIRRRSRRRRWIHHPVFPDLAGVQHHASLASVSAGAWPGRPDGAIEVLVVGLDRVGGGARRADVEEDAVDVTPELRIIGVDAEVSVGAMDDVAVGIRGGAVRVARASPCIHVSEDDLAVAPQAVEHLDGRAHAVAAPGPGADVETHHHDLGDGAGIDDSRPVRVAGRILQERKESRYGDALRLCLGGCRRTGQDGRGQGENGAGKELAKCFHGRFSQ